MKKYLVANGPLNVGDELIHIATWRKGKVHSFYYDPRPDNEILIRVNFLDGDHIIGLKTEFAWPYEGTNE